MRRSHCLSTLRSFKNTSLFSHYQCSVPDWCYAQLTKKTVNKIHQDIVELTRKFKYKAHTGKNGWREKSLIRLTQAWYNCRESHSGIVKLSRKGAFDVDIDGMCVFIVQVGAVLALNNTPSPLVRVGRLTPRQVNLASGGHKKQHQSRLDKIRLEYPLTGSKGSQCL